MSTTTYSLSGGPTLTGAVQSYGTFRYHAGGQVTITLSNLYNGNVSLLPHFSSVRLGLRNTAGAQVAVAESLSSPDLERSRWMS